MASPISGLTGLPKLCQQGYTGVDYFLVGDLSDVEITVDDLTKLATIALSATGPALLTDVFKKIVPKKQTSSLVNTKTGTPGTGAISNVPVATILVHGQEIEVEKTVDILSEGCLVVVSVDFNGVNKIGGVKRGMDLTTVEDTTGVGQDDMRGATITLTGSEPKGLYFLEDATLQTILPV